MEESLKVDMARQAAQEREHLGETSEESRENIPPSLGEIANLGERPGGIVVRLHAVTGLRAGEVACAARLLATTPGLPLTLMYRRGDAMCCYAPVCKQGQWAQLLGSRQVHFWASEAEEIARAELIGRSIVVEADQLLGNIVRPPCKTIVSPVTERPLVLTSDCRWKALQEIVRQAEEMARREARCAFTPCDSFGEIAVLATLDMNNDD